MRAKRAFWHLIGYVTAGMALVALFVFLIDPFYHYHKAWFGLPVILENAVYQTSGPARNFEYDSVIVGTSMTENFHASWFDETHGWNTLKLSYSGARTDDLKAILGQIFMREKSPENIVLDVNTYQLTVDPCSAYVTRPEYLYDSSFITDVSYLYNQDVLLACMDRIWAKLQKKESNLDTAYTWEDEEVFGKEKTLESEKKVRSEMSESHISMEICDANLENITTFIAEHPETNFYVFYPPYSMLYWEREMLRGDLEEVMAIFQRSIERLMEYENVKIYYFQNQKEIISDLENYRDATHYRPEYNKYICECFQTKENLLTTENYEKTLQEMYEYVLNFDYDAMWAVAEQR